jgi:D-alanyl-lipoteichoic acid acyltransferase DltB (MBOAT superfamily)
LWHGASWTFVVWGALHGAGLVVERVGERIVEWFGGTRQRRVAGAARADDENVSMTTKKDRPRRARSTTADVTTTSSVTAVVATVIRWLATFHVVLALWVFFRADSFERAVAVFAQLGRGLGGGAANVTPAVWAVLAAACVTHLMPGRWRRIVDDAFGNAPAAAQALAVVVALELVRLLSSGGARPFIYFQF